ncbi:MAG: hypothetical protein ACI9TY_000618 [Alphaproteobacteria bacterium]|jgi:hypothetical protein
MIHAHYYRGKLCFASLEKPSKGSIKLGINFFMPTGLRSKTHKFIWKLKSILGIFSVNKEENKPLTEKLVSISTILQKEGFNSDDIIFLFPMDETSKRIYFQTTYNDDVLFWKSVFDKTNAARLQTEFNTLQEVSQTPDINFTVSKPKKLIVHENICLMSFNYEPTNSRAKLSGSEEDILISRFAQFNQIEKNSMDIKTCSWWNDSLTENIPSKINLKTIDTAWAHGDLSAQNISFTKGKLRVFDWEDFTKDAPLYSDITRYLTSTEKQRFHGAVRAEVIITLMSKTKMSVSSICAVGLFLISKNHTDKPNLIGHYLINCINEYFIVQKNI